VRIDTIVVSSQHAKEVDLEATLSPDIRRLVVEPILETVDLDSSDFRLLVNPTGRFEIG
jgi:S-adenosylmethionine synthetase